MRLVRLILHYVGYSGIKGALKRLDIPMCSLLPTSFVESINSTYIC